MLLLTLRETYTLNSSFQNLRRKGGKFDHRAERPKVLLRRCPLLSDAVVRAELCPAGFVYYAGTDSCFYSSTVETDQTTAMSECQGMGADLPSIDNRAEMRFLLGIS